MNRWLPLPVLGLALALAGCSGEAAPNTRGVYLLMDTSGTYTKELDKAQALINALLAKLDTGDSFAVARVDTGSFSEKDIVARVTFDDRPSTTNQQKRKFREQIDDPLPHLKFGRRLLYPFDEVVEWARRQASKSVPDRPADSNDSRESRRFEGGMLR